MAKSVYELVADRLGVENVRAVENPEAVVQAQVADQIFLRANPMRYAFVFTNLSASDVFIRPGGAAAAATGLVVVPSGSITLSPDVDFTSASLEWHVLGAGANLAIYTLAIEGEPG
tara:strand:- start:2439 stop:2786 length:348 start_codon:yes stop_codon:yes gene_type:complete